MAEEIGRLQSGELLRINKDEDGHFLLEIAGEVEAKFKSREEAIKESKVMMLKSWLPGAGEEEIRNMLNSYLEIGYNFLQEWCEKQAEKQPDCDCGCGGYPLEMGTFWTWSGNKYRGCPECEEKISLD